METIESLKQTIKQMLDNFKEHINEMSDYEMILAISKLDAKHSGYVKESELVTYDKAMQRLNIKNRNTFSNLCKKYNIKNVKINNMNVGFHISDIERLCSILNNN